MEINRINVLMNCFHVKSFNEITNRLIENNRQIILTYINSNIAYSYYSTPRKRNHKNTSRQSTSNCSYTNRTRHSHCKWHLRSRVAPDTNYSMFESSKGEDRNGTGQTYRRYSGRNKLGLCSTSTPNKPRFVRVFERIFPLVCRNRNYCNIGIGCLNIVHFALCIANLQCNIHLDPLNKKAYFL